MSNASMLRRWCDHGRTGHLTRGYGGGKRWLSAAAISDPTLLTEMAAAVRQSVVLILDVRSERAFCPAAEVCNHNARTTYKR